MGLIAGLLTYPHDNTITQYCSVGAYESRIGARCAIVGWKGRTRGWILPGSRGGLLLPIGGLEGRIRTGKGGPYIGPVVLGGIGDSRERAWGECDSWGWSGRWGSRGMGEEIEHRASGTRAFA